MSTESMDGARELARVFRDTVVPEQVVTRDDLVRVANIISQASEELVQSFQTLNSVTHHEQTRLLSLADSIRGGPNDVNFRTFTTRVGQIIEHFGQYIASFAQEGMAIGYRVDEMVSQMDEIFRLVAKVDEIAESTNVLAINAALEAARAGGAGKGFAVVATEVRSLSKSTTQLNDEISERVEATRVLIDAVRTTIERMTARNLEPLLGVKDEISQMTARVSTLESEVERTLVDAAEYTSTVQSSTSSALRALQYQDIVTQVLAAVGARSEQMQRAVERIVTESDQQMSVPDLLRALADDMDDTEKVRMPATQKTIDEGELVLF